MTEVQPDVDLKKKKKKPSNLVINKQVTSVLQERSFWNMRENSWRRSMEIGEAEPSSKHSLAVFSKLLNISES